MQAILTILGGPHAGRKLWLRSGQAAEIGRGDSMDLAVPRDMTLAERHFALDLAHGGCRLRDLAGRGTLVNGQPATEATLRDGDRITAGQTTFTVQLQGDSATGALGSVSPAGSNPAAAATSQTAALPPAVEVCAQFDLSPEGRALLKPKVPADQFADQLVKKKLYLDAVRCMAFGLPRPHAIAWACKVAEQTMASAATELDRAALAAATTWLKDPNDGHRRAAFTAAQATEFGSPAGLAALAVFWSGGSIAPADLQEVSPAPHLCPQTIANSVILAAVRSEPQLAPTKFQRFLELAAGEPGQSA